jgi:prevent-host-death family protein
MSVNLGSLFEDSFPKIGVKELRQNASIYLERVKKGERFVITEWGHPVGILSPIEHVSLEDLVDAGFITPAINPNVDFNKKIIKLPDGVSATDLLLESRRKERS